MLDHVVIGMFARNYELKAFARCGRMDECHTLYEALAFQAPPEKEAACWTAASSLDCSSW